MDSLLQLAGPESSPLSISSPHLTPTMSVFPPQTHASGRASQPGSTEILALLCRELAARAAPFCHVPTSTGMWQRSPPLCPPPGVLGGGGSATLPCAGAVLSS